MAHIVKLDGLDLHDGVNYSTDRPKFQQPPKRTEITDSFQQDGGTLVAGTNHYGVVTHTIPVWCRAGTAGTIDSLMSNIRALQRKVLKRDMVFEFKFDGATNTNYADVLHAYCDDPYSSEKWDYWISKGKSVPINIHLVCKPFWRGPLMTGSGTSSAVSPVEVYIGDTRFEENDAAITYAGGTWTQTLDAGCSGWYHKTSSTTGAYAELTFSGRAFTIIGQKSNARGIAKIFIDGVPITDGTTALTGDTGGNKSGVDLYSSTTQHQVTYYSKDGLTPGTHTIKIQVSGQKNGSSSGYSLSIDVLTIVPVVQGDVPTPLRLWWAPTKLSTAEFQRAYFGVCSGSDPDSSLVRSVGFNEPINNAGTADIAGDNGYTYVEYFSNVDGTTFDGRFRVLARMRTADASPTNVKVAFTPLFGSISVDVHAPAGFVSKYPFTDNDWTIVDFGVVDLPPFPLCENYPSNTDDGWGFLAKGSSATAAVFELGSYVLLPLDSAFYMRIKVHDQTYGWGGYMIDSIGEDVSISEVADLGDEYQAMIWPGGTNVMAVGGPMSVQPGRVNRLVVASHYEGVPTASLKNSFSDTAVTWAYYPRYLSPVR